MVIRSLLLLALTACSGCTAAMLAYQEPVIVLSQTMPDALATTTCSLNNLPIIRIDSMVWHSEEREMVLVHEKVHADRAAAYRGGCWAFMYRINQDRAFRAKEQLIAFCAAGRFAIQRNHNPLAIWEYIVNAMAPDTTLTAKDNCLFESWEGA